jgi:polyhydroxybutyrate depolymerase
MTKCFAHTSFAKILYSAVLVVCVAAYGNLASASTRIERHISVDNLSRSYVVWLPDGYQQRPPFPVVLTFHGGGQAVESMEDNANLQNAREARNFVVVYAAGYEKSFNVGGYCCGAAARQQIDDLKYVRALLNDLQSVARIDRRRIDATGFSNGGQFSYYLACNMSNEIAAIAPVGGSMQPPFDRCHPTRPVSVFHWHGLADRFEPFEGGPPAIKSAPPQPPAQEGLELWKKFDGTRTTRQVDIVGRSANCTESSSGKDNASVVLCLVTGMGHHWPGSNPKRGNPRIIAALGPLGPPMDANDAILSFFSHYALP